MLCDICCAQKFVENAGSSSDSRCEWELRDRESSVKTCCVARDLEASVKLVSFFNPSGRLAIISN